MIPLCTVTHDLITRGADGSRAAVLGVSQEANRMFSVEVNHVDWATWRSGHAEEIEKTVVVGAGSETSSCTAGRERRARQPRRPESTSSCGRRGRSARRSPYTRRRPLPYGKPVARIAFEEGEVIRFEVYGWAGPNYSTRKAWTCIS